MSADDAATETDARECSACRGTGSVISNLGGSPSTVECPWCDGTGRFIAGHDAQARHRDTDPPATGQQHT
jgi:DnaJ-class molecular chaperone